MTGVFNSMKNAASIVSDIFVCTEQKLNKYYLIIYFHVFMMKIAESVFYICRDFCQMLSHKYI